MHRAGDAGDWAVAAHEIDEMQRLTRASSYINSRLGALMQGFNTAAGSTIEVTLDVDESLSMRHPHALRKSRAPLDHAH